LPSLSDLNWHEQAALGNEKFHSPSKGRSLLDMGHPRDLAMIAAVFGVASFVWSGWAQEAPPKHWIWRVVLGLFGFAGLALAALSVLMAIRHWGTATALQGGSVALTVYIIVFWVEVILAAVLAFLAIRAKRSDLIAPLILGVVGIHFLALAPVFAQPVLYLAAGLLTAIAIITVVGPTGSVARSFWCGVLGAPVFLVIGVWSAVAAGTTFGHL
jgi:hypothetical protein